MYVIILRLPTIVICAYVLRILRYLGFHTISFPEPALPLSSERCLALGADQKDRSLWERDWVSYRWCLLRQEYLCAV